jgi:glucose-6-phosphate 1-epimerase
VFVSSTATYEDGRAIRGGIPVIFPQFSDSGPLLKHGFARLVKWKIGEASEDSATLHLRENDLTLGLWPHPFAASLRIQIGGPELRLTLRIENTGPQTMHFTAALHGYYRVSDLAATRVEGLQGLRYEDQVTQEVDRFGQEPVIQFTGEVDRAYLQGGSRTVVLSEPGRRLEATASGFPDVVVWNPGAATGATLHDLHPNGYQGFVCIEAAAVGHPVTLAPGEGWEGIQTLTAG